MTKVIIFPELNFVDICRIIISMKLYLIGYMASGKTRVGKDLSQLSGIPFFDLDDLFEDRYHLSVFDFFAKYGEPLFRKLERNILLETAGTDYGIISTGGGAPCYFSNMNFIKENGTSVYLRMPVHMLINRIGETRKKRPVLYPVPADHLTEFVSRQIAEREPFYLQADYVMDGPLYPLDQIMTLLQ